MVGERKTVSEVLSLVRDGRAKLEAALAKVPEEDATKAMLGHVLHWEQVMVRHLGGVEPPVGRQVGTDATNAAVSAYHSARPFADVRREFDAVHRDLIRRIEALTDERMNSRPVIEKDEVVWQYIAGETWDHYPEHVAQLEARASTSGKG
jgi:hypothetical protein